MQKRVFEQAVEPRVSQNSVDTFITTDRDWRLEGVEHTHNHQGAFLASAAIVVYLFPDLVEYEHESLEQELSKFLERTAALIALQQTRCGAQRRLHAEVVFVHRGRL